MAARYWVGGSGNWSSTAQWSTTSGGASGASVPTSADDAIFDANSGSSFIATVDTAQTVNSLTITPASAAGVIEIAVSYPLTTGDLTVITLAGNSRVLFRGEIAGTAPNFTVNGFAGIENCDFRDIYVVGPTTPLGGSRLGNQGNVRGVTTTAPKTVYWSPATSGDWSGNNWATSSAGTPNVNNFPLAQDTAVIDDAGLSVFGTITLDPAIAALPAIDMSTRSLPMTLDVTSPCLVYGSLTFSSAVIVANTSGLGRFTFSGTSTSTITSAGLTLPPITIQAYGGTVLLADALNLGAGVLTLQTGTFNTNNYSVTADSFYADTFDVRSVRLGSSTVTLTGNNVPFYITNTFLLDFDCGTSTINFTGAIVSQSISFGSGITYYNVNFSGFSIVNISASGSVFNNLSFAAPSSDGVVSVSFSSGNTVITGALSATGTSSVRRVFFRANILGITQTITAGSLSADDCDFRDIALAGAASGAAPTRAGDCGGNSGITFPAPKTVYWSLVGGGNWSSNAWAATSGGTPNITNFPLAQDTAVFDNAVSPVSTVSIDSGWNVGTFDAAAQTNPMTLSVDNSFSVYKDWVFGTGVTSINSGTLTLAGAGVQTVTSNGVTFAHQITVDCRGTVQLADALTIGAARILLLTKGTFDAVAYNVTVGGVSISGSNTRTLKMGSGVWTLSSSGTVWNATTTTNLTLYQQAADILLSYTGTAARTFVGGSQSYNKLTIGGTTGTSTLTITNNNTFKELASIKTVAHTIALGTTTQTFGAWTVTGTVGNVVTLTGTGTSHVLAGPCTSGIDYLVMGSIGFSATASAGEFYAGANSTGTAAVPVYRTAKPADSVRYWRGGTGSWSSTTNWSTTSGGAGGASVPRSHDDVIFNSASSAASYNASVNAVTGGIRCKSLTISGPASGTLTLSGSTAIVGIHGSVTLPATGLTRTYTGAITLSGNSPGLTFTTNGVTLASSIIVNGIGSEWVLGSALNIGSSSITLTNGSLNLATYNLTAGGVASSAVSPRTLNLGSGTVSLNGSGPLNIASSASIAAQMSLIPGTSQLSLSATSPTLNLVGGYTLYDVSFTSSSIVTLAISSPNTFNNLSIAGRTSVGIAYVSIGADQTINGTLTLSAGTNAAMRTFVRSDTLNTTRTLTCASVSATDSDFRDITITGAAAPVSGTRLGDCKGNSGITFDAAKTVYWIGTSGGNWGVTTASPWATSSGGSGLLANFPLAQDTVIFDGNSGASGLTSTINAAYNIGTIDMSARTSNTMTLATSTQTPTIYGNWINGTGTTLTGTGTLTFAGRGSQTITSNGISFPQPFVISCPNGSVALQDAFTASNSINSFVHSHGTFDLNGYTASIERYAASYTTPRTLAIGTGTLVIRGSGSSAFTVGTAGVGMTITGTGAISTPSSSPKTMTLGSTGLSYPVLNQAGSGTMTISATASLQDITNTYSSTGATAITFPTFGSSLKLAKFSASGEAGRVLTLGSESPYPSYFVFTGTGAATTLTTDYLNVGSVRAYPLTNTWYAGPNSTNINRGSLGWYFEAGGGGPIAVFITESSTSSDSSSAAVAYNISVAEAGAVSEAALARMTYLGALAESAAASDVVAAVRAYLAAVAEAATATELVSAAHTLRTTIAELATGADTTAVVSRTTSPTVSETTQAVDSLFGSLLFSSSVAEALTAQELAEARLLFTRSITEVVTAQDLAAVAASIFTAATNDASGALDASQAAITGSSSLSESVVAGEAQAAQLTAETTVAETGTAQETTQALAVFAGPVFESAIVQDQSAVAPSVFTAVAAASIAALDNASPAGSIYNATLPIESAAIQDSLIGGFLWNLIDDAQNPNWGAIGNTQSAGWANIDDSQDPGWQNIDIT